MTELCSKHDTRNADVATAAGRALTCQFSTSRRLDRLVVDQDSHSNPRSRFISQLTQVWPRILSYIVSLQEQSPLSLAWVGTAYVPVPYHEQGRPGYFNMSHNMHKALCHVEWDDSHQRETRNKRG